MKTVSSIMKGFTKTLTALEKVSAKRNKVITRNKDQIKVLKQENTVHQQEISAAAKTANALKRLLGV